MEFLAEFWDGGKQARMEIKKASIFTFVGSPFFFLSGFTLIPRGFLLFRKKKKQQKIFICLSPDQTTTQVIARF